MSSAKIGIIHIGFTGNIFNIIKSINYASGKCGLIQSENDFKLYDKYIFPGVGAFPYAIEQINKNNLFDILVDSIKNKPTLGICLGFQIMFRVGYEFEETYGLDIISGEVRKINCNGVIPNMGFNKIEILKESPLFTNIDENEQFYFMHSYEVINHTEITAITTYKHHSYVCAVQKGNIFGVQFHPEKSRKAGIQIFKNFIKL